MTLLNKPFIKQPIIKRPMIKLLNHYEALPYLFPQNPKDPLRSLITHHIIFASHSYLYGCLCVTETIFLKPHCLPLFLFRNSRVIFKGCKEILYLITFFCHLYEGFQGETLLLKWVVEIIQNVVKVVWKRP